MVSEIHTRAVASAAMALSSGGMSAVTVRFWILSITLAARFAWSRWNSRSSRFHFPRVKSQESLTGSYTVRAKSPRTLYRKLLACHTSFR